MDSFRIKILKNFLLFEGIVFVVIGIISYIWIKNIYIEQAKNELIQELQLISLELENQQNVSLLVKNIEKLLNIKLTLIEKSKKSLLSRELVYLLQTTDKRTAIGVYHDKTEDKRFFYVARELRLGTKDYIIRIAKNYDYIDEHIFNFLFKLFLFFFFIAGVAIYIVLRISEDIRYEIEKAINFIKDMPKKTSLRDIRLDYSKEFAKLAESLRDVLVVFAKKNKKKSKYTAKLKLANRQKDEILSAVSHEFKNPISVIMGYSQTLVEDKEINPKIRDKFLNKIHSSAVRLTAMIDRLRLFIKLEKDSQPIKCADVDVGVLVRETIEELSQNYPGRKIRFNQGDKIIKKLDEALFHIAVTNLIENALKYSEDEVDVVLNENSLEVRDKGIGIDKTEIKKITTKFYRSSGNGWNNSLGIGLSLVEHIVRVHKFSLKIESKKAKGSVFKIEFS